MFLHAEKIIKLVSHFRKYHINKRNKCSRELIFTRKYSKYFSNFYSETQCNYFMRIEFDEFHIILLATVCFCMTMRLKNVMAKLTRDLIFVIQLF